jgi:DegV family protein with EDD domain
MAGVVVVTDSTASLSAELAEPLGVAVVPLQVVIDDVSGPEAAPGAPAGAVTPAWVAQALREGRRVTTSRPTPEVFAATYERLAEDGFDAVVSVHLSRALSGTVEAAEIAAAEAALPVTVVDSGTLAMATGFAVLAGAAAAADGATSVQTAAVVRARTEATDMYFCVDSLEYLRRGGRIGAAAALIGSALSVKPLLTVSNGSILALERVRTASRALARLEELGLAALAKAAGQARGVDLAVHHLDDAAGAERLADALQDRLTTNGLVVVAEVSAVLGVHVGPGTLGVVVSPRL